MSALAPTLQAFFSDRLITQRRSSPHTIAAYRDTFRLLVIFACKATGKAPCRLDLGDVNGALHRMRLDHDRVPSRPFGKLDPVHRSALGSLGSTMESAEGSIDELPLRPPAFALGFPASNCPRFDIT